MPDTDEGEKQQRGEDLRKEPQWLTRNRESLQSVRPSARSLPDARQRLLTASSAIRAARLQTEFAVCINMS